MSLNEQVLAQAQALTGELEGKYLALLTALCDACVTALTARLKDGLYPEDCEGAFVMAAAFQAAASYETAAQESGIQEFKAGDLSIKQGSTGTGNSSGKLLDQAEVLMRPYVKDGFCFTGV